MTALLFAAVAVGWFGLLQLILWSVASLGWRPFARHYACAEVPEGDWLSWRSAKIGLANYSASLSFVVTEAGLYMRPMWLFSAGHRPLLLPWSELQVTFHRQWLGSYYELRAERVDGWTIRLPKSFGSILAGRMAGVESAD